MSRFCVQDSYVDRNIRRQEEWIIQLTEESERLRQKSTTDTNNLVKQKKLDDWQLSIIECTQKLIIYREEKKNNTGESEREALERQNKYEIKTDVAKGERSIALLNDLIEFQWCHIANAREHRETILLELITDNTNTELKQKYKKISTDIEGVLKEINKLITEKIETHY
jgi:hypothetical protein